MKYKRKKLNLSIKREFQLWLLIRIAGTVMTCALVSAVILYFYTQKEISDSFFEAHIQIRRVSDLLLPVIAAGAAISLISGCLIALFLPQKIAGPLFRIERFLQEARASKPVKPVKLRHNDPLQDFATNINVTVETLWQKIEQADSGSRPVQADDAGYEKSRHAPNI